MNVYTVYVTPKAVAGGIGNPPSERTITIVTGTFQDAMNIARTKITDKEEVTGAYTTATDVVVDYSNVIGTS